MNKVLFMITAMHSRLLDATSAAKSAKDRGAVATEYALLVAFIALAIVVAVTAFGSSLSSFFTDLGKHIGITGANS